MTTEEDSTWDEENNDALSNVIGAPFSWMEGDEQRFRLYFAANSSSPQCLELRATDENIRCSYEENAAIDPDFLPLFIVGNGSDHPMETLVGQKIKNAWRTSCRILFKWSPSGVMTSIWADTEGLWMRLHPGLK